MYNKNVNTMMTILLGATLLILVAPAVLSSTTKVDAQPDKTLQLKLTKSGLERYINIETEKVDDSTFRVYYWLNESLKKDLAECKDKNDCDTAIKAKYTKELKTTDVKKSVDMMDKLSLKSNSKKLIISEDKINTTEFGYFTVTLANYSENIDSYYKGETFKIGENSVDIEIVESADVVGKYASIALDSNGKVHISHFDDTNDNLRYCTNSGGAFSCAAVDTANSVGMYTSIAIDSNNKPHISHYDLTNGNLRYCNKTGVAWGCEAVDTADTVGLFTSIAIDSSDNVHILHYGSTKTEGRYCNSTAGSGAWTCGNISLPTSAAFGRWGSIAIDSDDDVHAVFADSTYFTMSHCYKPNASLVWECQNATTVYGDTEEHFSVAVDSTDKVHVILRQYGVAHYLSYCSNLGDNTTFTCAALASGGVSFPSIAIDKNNKPHITYSNYSDDRLYYANKTGATWQYSQAAYSNDATSSFGQVNGRALATKNGVLSTSTSYNEYWHGVFYNESASALVYIYEKVFDYTVPNYTGHVNNGTGAQWGEYVHWNVTLADNTALANYSFKYNNSGAYVNVASGAISGLTSAVSVSKIINAVRGQSVCGRFYVTDNGGNNAQSNLSCVTVANSIPTTPTLISPAHQSSVSHNWALLKYNSTDADNQTMWFFVFSGPSSTGPWSLLFNGSGWASSTYNWTGLVSGSYYWKVRAGDTFDNSSDSSVRKFTVSLNAPAITLNYPTDNYWFNTRNITSFNFTATDPDGIQICELWHNLSGTWHRNYTSLAVTSGVEFHFNQTTNLTDESHYVWNINCTDTVAQSGFSANNFTFHIDSVEPVMNAPVLTTTTGSQSFTFTIDYSDFSTGTCTYSIYNTLGVIDGLYNHVPVICDTAGNAATVSAFGSFTLVVYGEDQAGNIGNFSKAFTTTAGGGGGGGGGSTYYPPPPVNQTKNEPFPGCGDKQCSAGEDPLNCPVDCKLFSLEEMFCLPIFNCGNWTRGWFINWVIIIIVVGMVLMSYQSKNHSGRRL